MENREIYKEVETNIAPFYPEYYDTPEFRSAIERSVKAVKFELNLPTRVSAQYVRNIVMAYKPKVDDDNKMHVHEMYKEETEERISENKEVSND